MIQQHVRLVATGAAMVLLAAAFFLYMQSIAPRSNDPVALMRTVGAVSGAFAAVGVVMGIIGMLRKKANR
jgi:flagellar motor component MotA